MEQSPEGVQPHPQQGACLALWVWVLKVERRGYGGMGGMKRKMEEWEGKREVWYFR